MVGGERQRGEGEEDGRMRARVGDAESEVEVIEEIFSRSCRTLWRETEEERTFC